MPVFHIGTRLNYLKKCPMEELCLFEANVIRTTGS